MVCLVRINPFQKVCCIFNIVYLQSVNLENIKGYLSGLFDSDGSIYLNRSSGQVFITISQKTRFLLDLIYSIYGGTVYYNMAQHTAFKWTVYRKIDVLNLINNYFIVNNCISAKQKRILLAKEFYELNKIGALKASKNTDLNLKLISFIEKWEFK